MDVRYINPFIESLVDTFSTMTGLTPVSLAPFLKDDQEAMADITGLITFASDTVRGSVALSLDEQLALMVFERFTGDRATSLNADVTDCVGELANMVAGGAKSRLSETGQTFRISLPKVQIGREIHIDHNIASPAIVIPFDAGGLALKIEVAMEQRG